MACFETGYMNAKVLIMTCYVSGFTFLLKQFSDWTKAQTLVSFSGFSFSQFLFLIYYGCRMHHISEGEQHNAPAEYILKRSSLVRFMCDLSFEISYSQL